MEGVSTRRPTSQLDVSLEAPSIELSPLRDAATVGSRFSVEVLLELPSPPKTHLEREAWAEGLRSLREDRELMATLAPELAADLAAKMVMAFHTLDSDPGMGLALVYAMTDLLDFDERGSEWVRVFEDRTMGTGHSLLAEMRHAFAKLDRLIAAATEGPLQPEAVRAWASAVEETARGPTHMTIDGYPRGGLGPAVARPQAPLTTFTEMFDTAVRLARMEAPPSPSPDLERNPAPMNPVYGNTPSGPTRTFTDSLGAAPPPSSPQELIIKLMSNVESSRQRVIDEMQGFVDAQEVSQARLASWQADLASFETQLNLLKGLSDAEINRLRTAGEDFKRGVSR